ncbi:hypothetical protein P691DRAFT_722454 [Macrolepiota fuliginosa MF-IS2]|uniref:Six-hairpin glycosidase n=1 Tax=Macrolepiota fuliginosa MF-IS2 TaxID=1400762 RepID=A0A9P6C8D9_9AGAR|nr:hypothetical protein P691DRAFT_722454 [Macrolepiota fuliginosa MF-IS2]
MAWLPTLLATTSLISPVELQPGFSESTIARVRTNLIQCANRSWELGTAAEALTELSWPALSVFNKTAFPPPAHLNATLNATDVLAIANRTVSAKPPDSLPLIANEGSAADPASIGVAVILANWTLPNLSNQVYSKAATDQLTYLLEDTPRSESGAISHRAQETQLWSDFVYMVPPFIAYYGALQGGENGRVLLQTAYDQCRLYRDALRDESGLWKHVVLGAWQDNTHWATGNAWAAAGMLRVHQTLNHSSLAGQFVAQQANLTQWINEILETSWAHQTADGGLRNVIDNETFYVDTASTALMTSVTYRMAAIQNTTVFIPAANLALKLVQENVDAQGWLLNATNPYTFDEQLKEGEHSPEGQAFILLLHAAWQAFIQSTSPYQHPGAITGTHGAINNL